MRRALLILGVAGLLAAGAGLWLTRAQSLAALPDPAAPGDPVAGAQIYAIGGCASCHAAPDATPDTSDEAKNVLAGGLNLKTPFGTFVVPNISPHREAGIGAWSEVEFLTAMWLGTSPEGAHYYPAFPYSSYARMRQQDVIDLFAYIKTLPASDTVPQDHDLGFPFNIRLALGGWKLLNMNPEPVQPVSSDPQIALGQYLVEGPGHCAECHTPRNALGGLQMDRWMAGGPNPDGPGKIPNITPHESGLGWSAGDIAYYLETGFTPDFDSAGGSMAAVIRNTALLPAEDREAIAAYLKSLPPIASLE